MSIQALAVARGKTVLLVEDNAVNAFISVESLASMGVEAIHAVDGMEAVNSFKNRHFDAVLMDCEMPVMDGFEATRLIREHELQKGGRRTPIIALTANALTGDREHCLERGMDDYLTKPIELRQLSLLIAKWLGSAAESPLFSISAIAIEASAITSGAGSAYPRFVRYTSCAREGSLSNMQRAQLRKTAK